MENEYVSYLLVLPILIGGIVLGVFISAIVEILHDYTQKLLKKKSNTKWLIIFIAGIIAPIVIGLITASTLGNPSCEEYSDGPQQTCISRSEDGFKVTYEQRKEKFKEIFFQSSFILTAITIASIASSDKLNSSDKNSLNK